jgi:hypothetical protein
MMYNSFMQVELTTLFDKYQTVAEIKKMIRDFHRDLLEFPALIGMNINEYYDFVKNIPYVRDVKKIEITSRPKYLLTMFDALDCKKKSILMGSYMKLNHGDKSYRLCLSSNSPDKNIKHIFTQIFLNGNWINADATYSKNKIGQKKRVTNFEIVK